MEKKTYSCDKCEKEVEGIDELRSIVIGFGAKRTNVKNAQIRPSNYVQNQEIDLCVNCLRKIGIVSEIIEDEKPVEKVQNVEDKLYDIVSDLVYDAMDNQ